MKLEIFESDILVYLNGQLLINGIGYDVWRNPIKLHILEFGARLRRHDIVQIIYM